MYLFVEPSELKSNSLFPVHLDIISCPGLEARTGADFYICTEPIMLVDEDVVFDTLFEQLILDGAVFVQRKSGNDMFSFQQLKESIHRMKQCSIPQSQCVLLMIGQYYQDKNGYVRVQGSKRYGETTWKTFQKTQRRWIKRGGIVSQINNESELLEWIESQLEIEKEVSEQPEREFYNIKRPQLSQHIIKVKNDDWRSLVIRGWPGLGEKTVHQIDKYFKQLKWQRNLWTFLNVVTSIDKDGKPLFINIPGIGPKKREMIRDSLGLREGENLCTYRSSWERLNDHLIFKTGWQSGIKELDNRIGHGMEIEMAIKTTLPFVTETLDYKFLGGSK